MTTVSIGPDFFCIIEDLQQGIDGRKCLGLGEQSRDATVVKGTAFFKKSSSERSGEAIEKLNVCGVMDWHSTIHQGEEGQ